MRRTSSRTCEKESSETPLQPNSQIAASRSAPAAVPSGAPDYRSGDGRPKRGNRLMKRQSSKTGRSASRKMMSSELSGNAARATLAVSPGMLGEIIGRSDRMQASRTESRNQPPDNHSPSRLSLTSPAASISVQVWWSGALVALRRSGAIPMAGLRLTIGCLFTGRTWNCQS